MILGGLWAMFVGYWVLYAGVAKLAGDTSCTLGRAIRGQCSGAPPTGGAPVLRAPGQTAYAAAQAARVRQLATITEAALA